MISPESVGRGWRDSNARGMAKGGGEGGDSENVL